MEKTRVKRSGKYWYIQWDFTIDYAWDDREVEDEERYEVGNYFHSKEEAEAVAKKIRAVLNGADVIETPSEEEIKERLNMIMPTGPAEPWCVEGYCKHMIDFVKSKIVQ